MFLTKAERIQGKLASLEAKRDRLDASILKVREEMEAARLERDQAPKVKISREDYELLQRLKA